MTLETYLTGMEERDWQVTTEGEVRFAMIALGWWTREKAIPAVEESTLATATVVVSGSVEKAEEVAGEWESITHALTYDEFHDGAAVDAYDAVYICTPNALHRPFVETAAGHDKAILCEKPMEATVERAEEIVAICSDADVPLMVAYRMHTEPAVRRARQLLRDGAIGDPVLVRGNMSQPLLSLIPDPDQWRLSPDLVGYGASIMDIGLYPLNTTRFVIERDPVAVDALAVSAHEHFADVPDERAAFQIAFEDGVLGSFTASQHAHQSSQLSITGTRGEITIDPAFFPWTDRGLRVEVDGTAATIEWEQVNQMTEEFDYFADCVLSERDPYADGEHGLVDMRTMQALYEAADTGRTIRL